MTDQAPFSLRGPPMMPSSPSSPEAAAQALIQMALRSIECGVGEKEDWIEKQIIGSLFRGEKKKKEKEMDYGDGDGPSRVRRSTGKRDGDTFSP